MRRERGLLPRRSPVLPLPGEGLRPYFHGITKPQVGKRVPQEGSRRAEGSGQSQDSGAEHGSGRESGLSLFEAYHAGVEHGQTDVLEGLDFNPVLPDILPSNEHNDM